MRLFGSPGEVKMVRVSSLVSQATPAALQDDTASRRWNEVTRRDFCAVMTASAGAFLVSGCGGGHDSNADAPSQGLGSDSDARVDISATTDAARVGAVATFVGTDTTTQGSWKGPYGADGRAIVGDSVLIPAYASVSNAGSSSYVWAQSSADKRALLKAASSDRIAGTWFSKAGFTIDVNLSDGKVHRIALYCLDWDSNGRVQSIDVVDVSSGTVLDTRSVSAFSAGKYLVWDISGNVRFVVTCRGGSNAVVSGLFFSTTSSPSPAPSPTPSPAPAPGASSQVVFVAADTSTRGTWQSTYGADGNYVVGSSSSPPAYAKVSALNKADYVWVSSTSDSRALQKVGATDRVAACWYSAQSFSVDVNLTDGQMHRVAVYCLDWDASGRSQLVEILDPVSGVVLDTRTVSSFSGGVYLVWNLVGHVVLRVTSKGGPNAAMSGLFFGTSVAAAAPAPAPAPAPSPTPAPSPAPTYSISISWTTPLLNSDGSSLTDIKGYVVRYGTSPSNLSQSVSVQGASMTSATISGLAAGTYYVAVATVNSAGTTSTASNAVSKTVP